MWKNQQNEKKKKETRRRADHRHIFCWMFRSCSCGALTPGWHQYGLSAIRRKATEQKLLYLLSYLLSQFLHLVWENATRTEADNNCIRVCAAMFQEWVSGGLKSKDKADGNRRWSVSLLYWWYTMNDAESNLKSATAGFFSFLSFLIRIRIVSNQHFSSDFYLNGNKCDRMKIEVPNKCG